MGNFQNGEVNLTDMGTVIANVTVPQSLSLSGCINTQYGQGCLVSFQFGFYPTSDTVINGWGFTIEGQFSPDSGIFQSQCVLGGGVPTITSENLGNGFYSYAFECTNYAGLTSIDQGAQDIEIFLLYPGTGQNFQIGVGFSVIKNGVSLPSFAATTELTIQ